MTATATDKPGGAVAPIPREPVTLTSPIALAGAAWNPFALMDRLDADAFAAEMQGVAADVLVYRIKEKGKGEETVGLSKAGIDECCTMLVQQGHAIREESIEHEMIGTGENAEAIFKCVAARYAVDPGTGRDVRLDQVIGVKREPLYEERAPLTLDSRVPGKRWRDKGAEGKHLTYREALDESHPANENRGEALGYLTWIVEQSSFDDATKAFVAAALAGVDVQEFAAGKRFNPFWYEHGAMKAARNARFRLIPAQVKAAVIALAKQTDRELAAEVETAGNASGAPDHGGGRRARHRVDGSAVGEARPRVLRREPKRAAYAWLFQPHVGVAIDTMTKPGDYLISDNDLQKALRFAERGLSGAEVRKGDGTKGVLDDDEIKTVSAMKSAIDYELSARIDYQHQLAEDRRVAADNTKNAGDSPTTKADDDHSSLHDGVGEH